MVAEITKHDKLINQMLSSGESKTDWIKVLAMHDKRIGYFQHERLIHLIVTMFVILFTLLFYFISTSLQKSEIFIVTLVLLVLTMAYIFHYFQLENGVQKLYKLTEKIEEKIN